MTEQTNVEAFEALLQALQSNIQIEQVADEALRQHLDCKGCGKID